MLRNAGRAVMQLNQKIAQSEQGKAQVERALITQVEHSQAVEAELTAAHTRTRQLEVCSHVKDSC